MTLNDDYGMWARYFARPVGRAWDDFLTAIEALAGTDSDAIHDNVAAEISAVAEKGAPVNADLVLVEDSEDSDSKKRVQLGNLPGGGGG